jgi:phosphoribosyl-dephospho-CoA transferase
VKVHDFLWISRGAELLSPEEPTWARDALARAAVVVVRRAEAPPGFIPVGIRGASREQRHAAFLRTGDVLARIRPESLAEDRAWHQPWVTIPSTLLEALEFMGDFSERQNLVWGPIGSVGYYLATGMPATNATSDLDVAISCTALLNRACLRALYDAIRDCRARVDVILEGPEGAVALGEYLQDREVLTKTTRGPRIAAFSW